jgi:hypothetical protein
MWCRDVCPSWKTFEFTTVDSSTALPFDPSKFVQPRNDKSPPSHEINLENDDDDPFAAFDDTNGFAPGRDGEDLDDGLSDEGDDDREGKPGGDYIRGMLGDQE